MEQVAKIPGQVLETTGKIGKAAITGIGNLPGQVIDTASKIGSTTLTAATKFGTSTTTAATESYRKFKDLLKDSNVIGFALAIITANTITSLSNNIIDNVVMPTINPMLEELTGKNLVVKFGPLTIQLDKLLASTIKFIVLTIIIFIIVSILMNLD